MCVKVDLEPLVAENSVSQMIQDMMVLLDRPKDSFAEIIDLNRPLDRIRLLRGKEGKRVIEATVGI
jgi:hypothetical protein